METSEIVKSIATAFAPAGFLSLAASLILEIYKENRLKKERLDEKLSPINTSADSWILIFGVAGLLFLLTSINSLVWYQGEWQKKKMVAELVMGLSRDTQDYQKTIIARYPTFQNSPHESITKITTNDAINILNKKDEGDAELNSALKGMLNHLEGLSTAYLNGVVDKEMFEESFKGVIQVWYFRLEEYLPVAQRRCDCTWPPFEKLGEEWQ